ncbi:AfsR/SARP family transcriptional regulator [Micromonospora mirobrigensis]|uniref:AfsR/SARP family transcriptional regulator n=1 Tax=Micromonospora mirobrigensis TaxID=262898 RepID=UPI00159EFB2D|nr:AfsR/SARP family transcriptional regulator [Micromonospora mirobrigensis]
MEANQSVPVDRLIDIVWDEYPPATARQQIQNRLGRLRSLLLRGTSSLRLVRQGNCYVLEATDEHIDGLRFRRLCAEAEIARQQGRSDLATGLLRDSLALWRGNAMQDVDSPALYADVAHWEESRLRVIESLVDLEFAQGNTAATIAELQPWVARHPYHEGLHCRLSEALHAAGRTAEALAVIRRLRHQLDQELAVAPGPEVAELERRILVGKEEAPAGAVQMDRRAAEALHQALTETTRALGILTEALARV